MKTTMRDYIMPTVDDFNNIDNKCCQGHGEIGTLTQCWWGYKMVHLLWKTAGNSSNRVSMRPSNSDSKLIHNGHKNVSTHNLV
jgi:hypothetical protein